MCTFLYVNQNDESVIHTKHKTLKIYLHIHCPPSAEGN